MAVLHPDLVLTIHRDRVVKSSSKAGHNWKVTRGHSLVGSGWAPGKIEEAFEDAIDDMRMLGLVTEE